MSVKALPIPPQPASSPFQSDEYKKHLAFVHEIRAPGKPAEWNKWMGYKMATAHTYYLDLIERVYAFAEYAVENDDLADYLGFADCAFAQIWEHHHFEETDLFPFWRKHVSEPFRAGLATNVDQHHLFARPSMPAGSGVKTRPSPVPEPPEVVSAIDPAEFGLDISKPFDPAALRREMDKWVPHCSRHMQEEIETLRPEFFDSMGEKRYMESEGILVKHLQAMDPTWFLVSCIASLPMPAVKGLCELPYPVRRLLVPFMWSGKYWSFWKYTSHPENLTFSGSA
ncbi:hypothetical protein EHS25_009281 [Saitozyma podzolica]|uniref:Hemerythrin-like domain-containing protein n=1 Tax=Saitozyma podzolica TaxID=1890683 RepID=A0A427YLI8_9TREE|nr:hypothetical protein EHS25_009281 [Saitozyma podzolica]